MNTPEINWVELRDRARLSATKSYAPYSRVTVGAAALTSHGTVVEGCNIENASYGLTLCAGCSLLGDLARSGGGELLAVAIVAGDGAPLAPCGRCRQLLFEHGGANLLIDSGEGAEPMRLEQLLPNAFGPDDLDTRSNA